MKFQFLRPLLRTDKFEETLDFYTGILGFAIVSKNDEWGWASLKKDEVWIMIAKPNFHEGFERPAFTGSLYFTIDEADALWESLKTKAKVCYKIETFPWGMREFAIYDNNGYTLQFGQNIEEQHGIL